MITDAASIVDMFCIFHDGGIEDATLVKDVAKFRIEIDYLAERIDPNFTFFTVALAGFHDAEFHAWPRENKDVSKIFGFEQIFSQTLDILEARWTNNKFEVVCAISAPQSTYCGGQLFFNADSAQVFDEANKDYTILELREISKSYWDEFLKRRELK